MDVFTDKAAGDIFVLSNAARLINMVCTNGLTTFLTYYTIDHMVKLVILGE